MYPKPGGGLATDNRWRGPGWQQQRLRWVRCAAVLVDTGFCCNFSGRSALRRGARDGLCPYSEITTALLSTVSGFQLPCRHPSQGMAGESSADRFTVPVGCRRRRNRPETLRQTNGHAPATVNDGRLEGLWRAVVRGAVRRLADSPKGTGRHRRSVAGVAGRISQVLRTEGQR